MSGNQYLFLFTIGPVQSFIEQARKTRDLYAGSAILGEIIDATMKLAQKEYGARIIIPDPESGAKPNRFLMAVTSESDDKVREIGGNLETAAKDIWIKLALESLQSACVCSFDKGVNVKDFDPPFCRDLLNKHEKGLKLPDGYRQQICDFLEVYWVGIKRTGSYAADYNNIQKLLAAIKNTRRFNQIDEPAARKCSLDGERNALFYRKTANNGKPAFIQRKHEDKDGAKEINGEKKYLLNPGEALSAVSFVKRFYKIEEDFPSTAEVALMNVLPKIDNSKKEEYKEPFGKHFDEQLYYEENLTDKYFRKRRFDNDLINRLPALREERKTLFDGYKQSRYYALVAFDGDDMGRIWSGTLLEESGDLEGFQESLAQQLGKFAEKAGEIVNTPKGKTVYAGGDDFLGFVNLSSLFEVMKDLREEYDRIVSTPIEKKYGIDGKLTFSAGVAIAHYKEPLSIVLREAHAAEAEAKKLFDKNGKDAFAISVLKHSGESRKCLFKWKVGSKSLIECQDEIVSLLDEKNGFSNTFIKNIDKEFTPLIGDFDDYSIVDLFEVELERLIDRSSKKRDERGAIGKMKSLVKSICESNYEYSQQIENIFSALHVCDFIKRNIVNE